MTIEEAWEKLTCASCAYHACIRAREEGARTLALAVLRECAQAEDDNPGYHWLAIVARIEALGQDDD